jgi:hypothetical protein
MSHKQHGDTVAFDSTYFLWDLIDEINENSFNIYNNYTHQKLWNNLHIHEIRIWAGDTLVNGLQVLYSIPSLTPTTSNNSDNLLSNRSIFPSPIFSSSNDTPVMHTLILSLDDEIISIQIYSGDLVDSVVIKTRKGIQFKVGGSGGSPSEEVSYIYDYISMYILFKNSYIVHIIYLYIIYNCMNL